METDLSKRAVSLSVGQKFLICLARIILSDCTLLILDEALSHVDKNSQKFIQEIINDKFEEKTVMTITHKLENVGNFTEIVFMDQGRIKDIGHPYHLYKKNKLFREMMEEMEKQAKKRFLEDIEENF